MPLILPITSFSAAEQNGNGLRCKDARAVAVSLGSGEMPRRALPISANGRRVSRRGPGAGLEPPITGISQQWSGYRQPVYPWRRRPVSPLETPPPSRWSCTALRPLRALATPETGTRRPRSPARPHPGAHVSCCHASRTAGSCKVSPSCDSCCGADPTKCVHRAPFHTDTATGPPPAGRKPRNRVRLSSLSERRPLLRACTFGLI